MHRQVGIQRLQKLTVAFPSPALSQPCVLGQYLHRPGEHSLCSARFPHRIMIAVRGMVTLG